ncbi:CNNM domain-containing protein [Halorarum salinum]|uniref:DUF21 domain-containing protein n=1 Tax=Halorarum salinum TaxID=2743089 RepID=A0A7D5LBX7_9EURY|nr:DUF21 domain-containing protein [Halobaculum salinum]QLG62930.1 DUF21 domain-containing protein [Halobaculum salinum]
MVELPTLLAGVSVTVVLLACSAFFSSSEIAVFSLPDEWIAERADAGDPRAAVLESLRGDPHRLLVTILVGNNVVNVAVSSVVTLLLTSSLPGGIAVAVATVLVSTVVLVFGEIVPKAYGLGNRETWGLRVAGPIRLVERALSPLVTAFDVVTRSIAEAIGGSRDIERLVAEK